MLVLTRKPGEKIQVGPDIKIVVVAIKGKQVKLGFECDQSIPIDRPECIEDPNQLSLFDYAASQKDFAKP